MGSKWALKCIQWQLSSGLSAFSVIRWQWKYLLKLSFDFSEHEHDHGHGHGMETDNAMDLDMDMGMDMDMDMDMDILQQYLDETDNEQRTPQRAREFSPPCWREFIYNDCKEFVW